ncbi:MAG: bifunctional folylpolyglutamate synthase/dihydrofolate synthase [Halioglobus sp.]|nr:bifunctional folylpolyglutamate synthase/dihydrofolate synthase [Halioglobus sp.]
MNRASLTQWLERLETLHPQAMDLGLERVSTVARTLELLPLKQPVVTVAGTNGKGSTVAVLEAILDEAGFSTGAFTSPHLLRFNERIRVAGVEAPDGDIVAAFRAIEEARGDVTLTYFEFAALAALLVFKSSDPDIVILEVGLGGRLDAVNIVDAAVAVITSIDLDHQGWLGESRGEIAREKAGILRSGKPVVIADPAPPIELRRYVDEIAAVPARFLGQDFTVVANDESWEATICLNDGGVMQLGPHPSGSVLPENICAAVQAVLLLGIECGDDTVGRALLREAPAGRRQFRQVAGRDYILDVAHNPAAVHKLLEYLNVNNCKGKTFCLFSVMRDKDVSRIVEAATGHFDSWFLADQNGNERAAKAADIAAYLDTAGEPQINISSSLEQAFSRASRALGQEDRLVVFGSFFTVAAVLPILDEQERIHGGP